MKPYVRIRPFLIFVVFFPLLFNGCLTIPSLYETSTITRGLSSSCGISYEWADYKDETLEYRYDFLRADLLFTYGLKDCLSIDTRFYGATGEAEYKKATGGLGSHNKNYYYYGGSGGIKACFFPSKRIIPAIQIGIQVHYLCLPVLSSTLLLGIKDEEQYEFLTFGIRSYGYSPYGACISLRPKIRLNPCISFGISLHPLGKDWVSQSYKGGLNPQDFSVGIGINF